MLLIYKQEQDPARVSATLVFAESITEVTGNNLF